MSSFHWKNTELILLSPRVSPETAKKNLGEILKTNYEGKRIVIRYYFIVGYFFHLIYFLSMLPDCSMYVLQTNE